MFYKHEMSLPSIEVVTGDSDKLHYGPGMLDSPPFIPSAQAESAVLSSNYTKLHAKLT